MFTRGGTLWSCMWHCYCLGCWCCAVFARILFATWLFTQNWCSPVAEPCGLVCSTATASAVGVVPFLQGYCSLLDCLYSADLYSFWLLAGCSTVLVDVMCKTRTSWSYLTVASISLSSATTHRCIPSAEPGSAICLSCQQPQNYHSPVSCQMKAR